MRTRFITLAAEFGIANTIVPDEVSKELRDLRMLE